MNRTFRAAFLFMFVMCLLIYGGYSDVYATNNIQRLSGPDRYGTAVEISKHGWQQTAQNVVLATGEDFPDALCAAPLAKLLNAPILLSGKTKLDPKVESELNRLSVKNVFIIGGYGVISKAIEDNLKNKGINVLRISGKDRYETSLAVANYQGVTYGSELFVTTGEDFPDALSVAAVAAKKGAPIVLSPKTSPHAGIIQYIKDKAVTKTYVIGGPGVIAETVKSQYGNSERVFGSNRYATNAEVVNKFAGEVSFSVTYLATGNDYPDALSGSALAPQTSSPIILVDKASQVSVKELIVSKFTSTSQLKVLGGEGVVAPSTLDAVIPKVVVSNVSNIFDFVYKGRSLSLPNKVTATMSNGTTCEVPVVWNPALIDVNKPGTYTFNGTVSDYGSKAVLTLGVITPTPIMGAMEITDPNKLTAYVKQVNPDFNPEIAKAFIDIGAKYGMRGDIAFCQSIHETNWFRFTGDAKSEWNNYSGIGVTGAKCDAAVAIEKPFVEGVITIWTPDNRSVGVKFATPHLGVQAQMQHLLAYAAPSGTPIPGGDPVVDPRFGLVTRGIAPNWEDLGGRWAVPGYSRDSYGSLKEAMVKGASYGQSIMKKFAELKAFK